MNLTYQQLLDQLEAQLIELEEQLAQAEFAASVINDVEAFSPN